MSTELDEKDEVEENDPISYDGDSEGEDDDVEEKHGLEGMGDVISKILNKKVDSSNVVLSKSKGVHKRKTELKEELLSKKAKTELLHKQRETNHVLPIEQNDAKKEAMLRRIATRGVVMLFNAVSSHQKTKAEKMKTAKTEGEKVKVEKSMKKSTFMDMLKSNDSKCKETKAEKKEDSNEATWNVLKNDFMLGSSLKHWDKDEEENTKKKKRNVEESLNVQSSEEENSDSESP